MRGVWAAAALASAVRTVHGSARPMRPHGSRGKLPVDADRGEERRHNDWDDRRDDDEDEGWDDADARGDEAVSDEAASDEASSSVAAPVADFKVAPVVATPKADAVMDVSAEVTPWFCRRDASRFSLFPIRDAGLWSMYKRAEASFWTAEEVDLAADVQHWEALSDGERHFLARVLAFFASSDGVVLENLVERFAAEVTLPEARFFYGFQIAIEAVHQEMYSLLLQTYVTDVDERTALFNAHELVPCVRQKTQWAQRWTASEASYAERLVAFAAVEGIFFSGSFCSVFWLRKRGLLPGLGFANELISRDEGLHCDFACALYQRLETKLPDAVVHKIIGDAVEVERHFVEDALPVSLVGMNAKLMTQYVQYVADRLLLSLGHPKLYNAANPFDWMELMSLSGKTNFFEKRVAEYSRPNVAGAGGGASASEAAFNADADF